MNKKQTVTIQGREYPVVFDMATALSYEEITDKSFFGEEFTRLRPRLALVFAAIYAADNNTDLTMETLMKTTDWKEFNEAFTLVMQLAADFFKIPKVVADAEAAEAPEQKADDEQKNG